MALSSHFFAFMQLLLSLLLFHSVALAHFTSSNKSLCNNNERSALLQFKKSLAINETYVNSIVDLIHDGDSCHPKFASWKPEEGNIDCCLWDGVECSEKTGHVIKLDLSNSCLFGSINSSNSLFHLVHLEWLNLAYNFFSFSEIPSAIMNLSKLSYLNLSYTYFFGQIPSEILELSNLELLDLSLNSNCELQKPSLGNLLEKLRNVKHLDLGDVTIASSIPHNLKNLSSSLTFLSLPDCQLQGNIPSSIGDLTNLIYLDLSSNQLLGELPASIGNLASLEELDLAANNFSSELPTAIGNLASLEVLYLSANGFSSEWPTFIGNLSSLKRLAMYSCTFWGKLPPSMGNLTQLQSLGLSSNLFSGELPASIGNIRSLENLQISYCNFSGQIPSSLSNLTQLTTLDLSHNNFSETVNLDLFLTGLKSLEFFSLSLNKLSLLTKAPVNNSSQKIFFLGLCSCDITQFPNFLKNQHQLLGLDLSFNKIQGKVPKWFLNTSVQNMNYLNLSHNLLTGFDDQHPIFLSRHPYDSFTLDISFNNLQGPLPVPPKGTTHYLVSNNNVMGEIPPWICKLSMLGALDLSYNNLSGELPRCLGSFSDLMVLQLKSNRFSGSIPHSFMMGSFLTMIDLSNNLLRGRISRSLANCRELQFLDLGNNQLNDTFPIWLGTLPNLKVLILQSNRLHGTMEKTKTSCGFPQLRIVDLSNNRFTGKLPSKIFKCWNAMKIVNKSQLTYMGDGFAVTISDDDRNWFHYYYSLTMSNKGITLAYEKISSILVAIILSSNKFEGEIPASMANLRELQILNLSNNQLQGQIPSSLSNLTNLESLDLSNNKFSGQIPQKLVELTFLAYFNVSYNNLTGPIPQGNQFTIFDNSSFDGNSGLCGKSLTKKCENDSKTTGRAENEDILGSKFPFAFDWIIVLIGYSGGLIVGVILGLNFSTGIQAWFLEKLGKQPKRIRRNRRRRGGM